MLRELDLEHLQPRPQQAPRGHFFGAGTKKTAQSRPQDAENRRFGTFFRPAVTGRTRRAGEQLGAPALGKSTPGPHR